MSNPSPNEMKGIAQPPRLNPNLKASTPKKWASPQELLDSARTGDRLALGRCITILESSRFEDQNWADQLIQMAMDQGSRSFRIGVSGAPGVGKSTLLDVLGVGFLERGHRVAVLTVDPSSRGSGGSILGDKSRMSRLASDERAYIRPSSSRGAMGGVADTTRETILLCEAAGFDLILVETVGVGQSEVAVHDMTDLFLLLASPAGGDELQGIKRGIMEMADIIAVTKADGQNETQAKVARQRIENALGLMHHPESTPRPVALMTSATTGLGVEELLNELLSRYERLETSGMLAATRGEQWVAWFDEAVREAALHQALSKLKMTGALEPLRAAILKQETTPRKALREVVTVLNS